MVRRNGHGKLDEVMNASYVLVFEAAGAEIKVNGPGAVDDGCGFAL